MVEHALEIEGFALFEDVDVETGEGDMLQLDSVTQEFEEADFCIKGVKTGEDVLAIVFIECETGDCDVTGVDIDGDTIDMHLATHQLFSVAIDIAFGNGRYEYGRQYDDSEQDTYDPQDYFPRTFHIFKYYRQRQGGAFIVSSFVFL